MQKSDNLADAEEAPQEPFDATNDLATYVLTCEVRVTPSGEEEKSEQRACGEPAVNGWLCVTHSRRARDNGVEEALRPVYGCGPCAKVIVRGFDADDKEYRMVHLDADETCMSEEMRDQYAHYLETAASHGVKIVRGPFVIWQSAFEVDHAIPE